MAAASIKMDELLVSWLGQDAVYEEALNRIEMHRVSTTTNPESPPGSPSRRGSSSSKKSLLDPDGGGDSSLDGNNNDQDEDHGLTSTAGNGDEKSTSSPRGVKDIPPFYRPPGTRTEDGNKAPPIRRKREDGFDSDQSWDGTFQKLNEHQNETSNTNANNDSGTAVTVSSSLADSQGEEDAGSTTQPTTPAPPRLPIKEQVAAIYSELGKLPSTTMYNENNSKSDKYLTMDNFVKITKDICSFPTFFNGPLYKRILYLWNIRNDRSNKVTKERRLELWKEYYDNEGNTLVRVLGKEPKSTADDTDNSNNGDVDSKKNDSATDENDENNTQSDEKTVSPIDDGRYGTMLITYDIFRWFWIKEMEDFDLSERFFRLVKKPNENFIMRDDFSPFIKELLRDHPGLEFLSNHAEFQDKYAVTVITRIFYSVNKCHSGRITSRQIRRSDLLSAFQQVDEEEDINKVTRYFSYEHFYVLYCRFWELDNDRDYKITREDLLKYGEQCLSHMIVDRIFDAAPRPFEGETTIEDNDGEEKEDGDTNKKDNDGNTVDTDTKATKESAGKDNREYLTYEDFIFFMLSEEDKANEISVRYWFTCIDVDGDSKLNNMEMRSFYALQQHRMQSLGHEHIPFEDMLCQMIDMIKPANEDYLIVEDFLQTECAPVSGALFDALFNLNKYMQFEQRDPFQERHKREDEFETDWDRFACMDYNRLAMEEEAREEDAMEIDWVTVEDDDDDAGDDYNSLGVGGASEAPF